MQIGGLSAKARPAGPTEGTKGIQRDPKGPNICVFRTRVWLTLKSEGGGGVEATIHHLPIEPLPLAALLISISPATLAGNSSQSQVPWEFRSSSWTVA